MVCPTCGYHNAPGADLCGACGIHLPASSEVETPEVTPEAPPQPDTEKTQRTSYSFQDGNRTVHVHKIVSSTIVHSTSSTTVHHASSTTTRSSSSATTQHSSVHREPKHTQKAKIIAEKDPKLNWAAWLSIPFSVLVIVLSSLVAFSFSPFNFLLSLGALLLTVLFICLGWRSENTSVSGFSIFLLISGIVIVALIWSFPIIANY